MRELRPLRNDPIACDNCQNTHGDLSIRGINMNDMTLYEENKKSVTKYLKKIWNIISTVGYRFCLRSIG